PHRFAQHLRRKSIHSRRFSAPYAWHLLLLESLSFAPYYFDSFSLYSCNCSFKVAGISSYMFSIKSETFCFGSLSAFFIASLISDFSCSTTSFSFFSDHKF